MKSHTSDCPNAARSDEYRSVQGRIRQAFDQAVLASRNQDEDSVRRYAETVAELEPELSRIEAGMVLDCGCPDVE